MRRSTTTSSTGPTGFAFQRVYTDAESPLHRAGHPIDALLLARNDDAVLVPEGYHPVTSAPGYTTYYLNVLAGSAQSLANSEDPRHAWVREQYAGRDPRVPIYPVEGRGRQQRSLPSLLAFGRAVEYLYCARLSPRRAKTEHKES